MGGEFRDLAELIREKVMPRSALVVSDEEVHLDQKEGTNRIYILELGSSTAAGGRAGGFGRRTAQKVYGFRLENGVCTRTLEVSDNALLEEFELPFHASAVSLYLEDGTEEIVSGVVDPDLVEEYDQEFSST
ncbi:MAG: hypothetical protein ACE5KH_05550 [Candidatus Geothermarchaeales archaeon]